MMTGLALQMLMLNGKMVESRSLVCFLLSGKLAQQRFSCDMFIFSFVFLVVH